jgi:hypothetical protein
MGSLSAKTLAKNSHAWAPLMLHKHDNFKNTFFAEKESLWSQGPVTLDF